MGVGSWDGNGSVLDVVLWCRFRSEDGGWYLLGVVSYGSVAWVCEDVGQKLSTKSGRRVLLSETVNRKLSLAIVDWVWVSVVWFTILLW